MGIVFKNRSMISVALTASLLLAGCSGSDEDSGGGSGTNTPPPASSIATGKGVDGYIAGAHLYADIDDNHAENSGDLSTTTDDSGNFTFSASVEHGKYLYLSGGTDVVTHSAFTGVLSASYQGTTTIVSPLSTMVVALMQQEGLSYEEAVARVALAMGLETAQVVADPYAQPGDITLFVASQRVISAAITMGDDFTAAVQALAAADMNVTQAANSLGIPPTEVEAVDAYLQDLGPRLPLGATAEELATFQNAIDDAIDDPSNIPSAEDSATVSNAYGCLEFATIKGQNSSENNITSDLNITACDARNPDASLTWSSSDPSVIAVDGIIVRPVYTATTAVLEVSIVTDTVSRTRSYTLTIPRLDNHLPVSVADQNTTNEGIPISFNVLTNDSDADGDTLSLVAVSNGVAFSADGRVTYTPEENFNGLFNFNYSVRDSWGDEVNESVSITVIPENDAPQLMPIASQSLPEDFGVGHLTINATDDDTPATSLTYSVVSVVPAIVNASFTGSELDLTSKQDLNGDANITVMVSDGDSNSTRSFMLTVTPVDDAPVLSPLAPVSIDEDSGIYHVTAVATDIDNSDSAIAYALVSTDTSILTVSGMDLVSVSNAYGNVDINVTATSSGLTDSKIIHVTVNAVDDAPLIDPISNITVTEDNGTIRVTPHATDIDNNDSAITYTYVSSDPSIVSDGTAIATMPDANGVATITVTAISNGVNVSTTFDVTVTPVEDAPTIGYITSVPLNLTESATEQVIRVDLNITDVDSALSSVSITGGITNNADVLVSGVGNYYLDLTVAAYSNGDANITVTVSDGANSSSDTFGVHVAAEDSVAVVGTTYIDANLSLGTQNTNLNLMPSNESFTLSLTDTGDTNIATFNIVNGSDLEVTPLGHGTTSVTIHAVNDANNTLTSDTDVTIHVFDPANLAPVAQASTFSVVADEVTQVTLVVSDPEGDPLSFTHSTPVHGRIAAINDLGEMVYVAEDGFIGEDSFTYVANDGDLDSNEVNVTVDVTATTQTADNNDETPITFTQYNGYSALPSDGINMYTVWENGGGDTSNMEFERLEFNASAKTIKMYKDFNTTPEMSIAYEVNNPDDNEMLVDFDQNGTVDFKVKYIGTATKEEIEIDKNLTLAAGATGYKLATLKTPEEYEVDDDPEYQDWNSSGGYHPYSTLDDYFSAVTFDGNTTSNWHSMEINGYNFMFAQGSSLIDGSGTIVRYGHYNDGSSEHLILTNPNAGTWEVVQVNGNDVIKVTPSVYGLIKVRTYQVDSDTYVHAGEYHEPNRASLEYKYDESTMYHVANSIMNQEASLPVVHYNDVSYHMLSFNSMPDITLVKDTWMHSISAYTDNGNYVITMHSLKFDSNGTLEIRDTQDGDMNMTYTMSGNVATLTGIGIEAKLVELETNATRLIDELGITDPTVFDSITPLAYRLAHLEPQAELEIGGDKVYDSGHTMTYPDFNTFETAFMNRDLYLDDTPQGNKIAFRDGVSGVGGRLSVFSTLGTLVEPDAGTWSYATVDGNMTMVFDFYVEHTNERFNAVAQEGGSGDISRGHYKEADSGSVEYRLDDTTKDAVMTYLNDQNSSGTPQALKSDTPIKRTVTAVPFTNDNMYDASVDVNASTCDHNVTTAYIKFDGTTGVGSSGSYLMSSDVNYTFPYNSYDGEVVYVAGDAMLVKVAEELNASQLMDETSLYLPSTAHGYRVVFMYSDHDGDQNVALDVDTLLYFKSYLQNNSVLNGMCGTSTP